MDLDLARHAVLAAFRSSEPLQVLLQACKERLEPDEYRAFALDIADAIHGITTAVVNKALASHPELESEIEADLVTYGQVRLGESAVIAVRTLKLRLADGEVEVPLRLFRPEEDPDGPWPGRSYWSCRFQIDWPDEPETMKAHGHDSMQSLVLALQLIGGRIYASDAHKSGKLFFLTPGGGYGFPVFPDQRDLLVGDDRKYF